MYVCIHLQVIDKNFCLLDSLILGLGSLWFHARVHDRVLRSLKTSVGVHF
jgi:hypothetical protein